MSRPSLRLRLLLGSALWIAAALLVAGIALDRLYAAQALRRYDVEIRHDLDLVTSRAAYSPQSGPGFSDPLADSRAIRPLGGLYGQIASPDGRVARTRSLWQARLPTDVDASWDGSDRMRTVDVAEVGTLRLAERIVRPVEADVALRVSVAIPMAEIDADAARFRRTLGTSLGALAACLIAAAAVQVAVGLRPLATLRSGLAELRAGRREALAPLAPREIAPLVDDLNALLAENRRMVEAARAEAADLAHALKTPLTVLQQEAEALAQAGEGERAALLGEQVARMRRRVTHHLARARANAAAGERTPPVPVAEVAAGVVRVVERLAEVPIDLRVDAAHRFQGARQDLEEMLGNLLENAVQWASSRVVVRSEAGGGRLSLVVEDDGPGLPEDALTTVVERGCRLDERAPGSGLGLAIVDDLARAYAGALTLQRSPLGGLAASLDLPTPPA